MSLKLIGTPRKYRTDRGWRVVGTAAWTTTSLTGNLPIDQDCFKLSGVPEVSLMNGPSHPIVFPTTTIAATANFNVIAPYAGIITRATIVAIEGQAAHASIGWDWHLINKGQAAAGTAVVIDRADAGGANTNITGTVAAATSLVAYTPKALTITSVVADKTVAQGDVLLFTWTKSSTATTQTGATLSLTLSSDGSTGDERVWVDARALVNTTDGRLYPTDTGVGNGASRYTVTVNRFSTNPKSGAIFNFSYES